MHTIEAKIFEFVAGNLAIDSRERERRGGGVGHEQV